MNRLLIEEQCELDDASIEETVIDSGSKKDGNDLAWRFLGLGKLTGKTAAEIIAAVGLPTRSSMANGIAVLRWWGTGYHMTLLFDAQERVIRVAVESALA